MKIGNENENRWQVQIVILVVFFLYVVYYRSHPYSRPDLSPGYSYESKKKLEFYGRYQNFYKRPTTREAYYAIVELDSFKYRGDYIRSTLSYYFKGFYAINHSLCVKDSVLVVRVSSDGINNFKPNGLIYTTIGDSLIHFELKDGSFRVE